MAKALNGGDGVAMSGSIITTDTTVNCGANRPSSPITPTFIVRFELGKIICHIANMRRNGECPQSLRVDHKLYISLRENAKTGRTIDGSYIDDNENLRIAGVIMEDMGNEQPDHQSITRHNRGAKDCGR